MTRTVVVHSGGIGDLILAVPAIEELAKAGPVHVTGIRERAELLVVGGVIEAAYDLDDVDFHTLMTSPSERARDHFGLYDRAAVFMRDDGAIEGNLRECGVGEVLTWPGIPPDDWAHHASRWYLNAIGIDEDRPSRLCIKPDKRRGHIIHPGSGSAKKNMPIERFVAIAERLKSNGHDVEWLMGPAEEDVTLPPDAKPVEPKTLVEAARMLAGAERFYGNDSGMTHLAAAVNCKTVAHFGPTNPDVWAPLGEHVEVVREAF